MLLPATGRTAALTCPPPAPVRPGVLLYVAVLTLTKVGTRTEQGASRGAGGGTPGQGRARVTGRPVRADS